MRRTIIPLLLVLGAGSLASCGKGGYVSSSARSAGTQTHSSRTAPSTPAPTGKASTRERALAFAQAVNLTAEDVPGFSASEKHDGSSAREKRLERDMVRCAAGAGLLGGAKAGGEHGGLAAQSSKEFALKHGILDFSVSSEVSVQGSPAEALRALQAIRSAHVRNCFSRYLQQVFQGERVKGAKAGPVSIQSGIPPAPGTAGGFGWRVTASFEIRRIKVPIYLDFLGFVDGPAEVTLLSSGLLRPFPAEVQQRLFALLLARAKEHSL